MSDIKVRKSISLDDEDLLRIARLTDKKSPSLDVITRLFGAAALKSESSVLHALVVAGLDRIEQEALEAGYTALAEAQDDDDRAHHNAMRGRRG